MEVILKELSIKELCEGYIDNSEEGVKGYGGRLDIRPPYQREFVYNDIQKKAVIDTVKKGFPLNIMYWAVRDNGDYEIIDGQQRTLSICQYVNGDFSYDNKYFHNLTQEEVESILDYKLTVYECRGTESEKLKWFETINIAGEELTQQELRNAVYHGTWVTDAKKHFSKNGCPAYLIGAKYLNGKMNRQEYLETAIKWINNGNVEDYMARNQHKENSTELWQYFQNVIAWTENTFIKYRTDMKGLPLGDFYNKYKDIEFDAVQIESTIKTLYEDPEVKNKKGIYFYVLNNDSKHLNLRTFEDHIKKSVYEQQSMKCKFCNEHFPLNLMHADHIIPWSLGGKTEISNCQVLCQRCNAQKSDNY